MWPFFSDTSTVIAAVIVLLRSIHSTASLRRNRPETNSPPGKEDVHRVVEEQAALIDSLKNDKRNLEGSLSNLKSDHERVVKENQILRRAVTIQQDRQNQAETAIKTAHEQRQNAEEQVRKLEQMILTLRYHLQAQQPSYGNDFMGMPPRPPDVF